jgi:hypothetical protein
MPPAHRNSDFILPSLARKHGYFNLSWTKMMHTKTFMGCILSYLISIVLFVIVSLTQPSGVFFIISVTGSAVHNYHMESTVHRFDTECAFYSSSMWALFTTPTLGPLFAAPTPTWSVLSQLRHWECFHISDIRSTFCGSDIGNAYHSSEIRNASGVSDIGSNVRGSGMGAPLTFLIPRSDKSL